jgi:hypothetical protein
MRGQASGQRTLFVKIKVEEPFPADYALRPIKRMADEALAVMRRAIAAEHAPAADGGRPGISPERVHKVLRDR